MSEIDNVSLFKMKQGEEAGFTVQDYEGRREKFFNGLPCPVERHFFQVVDRADGKIKVLSVSKHVAREIMQHMTEYVKPKRSWFMRFLEWLGFVAPLPDDSMEFAITKDQYKGTPYPRYYVRKAGKWAS